MALRGHLGVRINSGSRDRHVTAHVDGLKFSKSAPGGHDRVSLTFKSRLYEWLDLGQNDRVTIYDATGRTLWSGYTEQPTASRGDLGETFELTALGGWSLVMDQTEKLMYLMRGADLWQQEDLLPQVAGSQVSIPGAYPTADRGPGGVDSGDDGEGRACLLVQFPSGTPLVTDSQVGVRFYGFRDSPMTVGGWFGFHQNAGGTSRSGIDWLGDENPNTHTIDILTPAAVAPAFYLYAGLVDPYPTALGTGEIRIGTKSLGFRMIRSGGAMTVSTDDYWAGIDPPIVVAQMLDKHGDPVTMDTAYIDPTTPALYAHQIIADLIGRMLPFIDPDRAEIAACTYPIDALSYPDGVTGDGVLSDLDVLEPDMLAEILEADDATGLHKFRWRPWPDEATDGARYVISTEDGFQRPGGDVSLCNRMAVYWTDEKGTRRVTEVTVPVPELDTPALGPARIRDAEPYTLPDGLGSEANAIQWGTAVLTQANRGTSAGQAVVARRIRDVYTAAWVYPWQIEPGYLVQVMETLEVHRLTAVEYDDDSCTATLTLGDPILTDEQRLAKLTRRGATTTKATR